MFNPKITENLRRLKVRLSGAVHTNHKTEAQYGKLIKSHKPMLQNGNEAFRQELWDNLAQAYLGHNKTKHSLFYIFNNLSIGLKLAAVAAIAVPIVLAGAVVASNRTTPSPIAPVIAGAQLSYTEGMVEVRKPGGNWQQATSGIELKEEYSVRVNGDGKALINFPEGVTLRLNSESAVSLALINKSDIVVENDHGEIYARVNTKETRFTMKSGGSNYTGNNSAFRAIKEEELDGIEVYQAKADVIIEGKVDLKLKEGQSYYFKNKDQNVKEIIALNPERLASNEFIQWNLNKDIESPEYRESLGIFSSLLNTTPTATPSPTPTSTTIPTTPVATVTPGINLSGSAAGSGIKLNWTSRSIDTSKGFKVFTSLSGTPNTFNSNVTGTTATLNINDGKTYRIRICNRNSNGACQTYSNTITVTAPQPPSSVTYINLTTTVDGNLSWTHNGEPQEGFKLVWTPAPGTPVYPGSSSSYLGHPANDKSDFLLYQGLSGSYNIRICEYRFGSCGVYSNQVNVNF